ncbi:hypothetical protein RSAG8_10072, partial [Rhizoctonia solani AG-8 WAC10335]
MGTLRGFWLYMCIIGFGCSRLDDGHETRLHETRLMNR